MTTYSMMSSDGGYWIVGVSISGSPMFVERAEGEHAAAQRVRVLQQRARDSEEPETSLEPIGFH